jgi:filamentous hemagglutinin
VKLATANGIPYGRIVQVGGWELKFAGPRAAGQLPSLIHALPR